MSAISRVDPAHHRSSEGDGQTDLPICPSETAVPIATQPQASEVESSTWGATAELIAAAAGVSAAHLPEQFETQRRQLAEQLLERTRDIDRREAQLNAHLAQLENEARTARLMVHEQTQRLSQQEQQYYARLEELARREAELTAREDALGGARSGSVEIDERRRALAEQQIRIEAEEHRQRLAWQQLQTQREAGMRLVRHLMRTLERRRHALDDHEQHRLAAIDADAGRQHELVAELEERRAALMAAQQEVATQRAELAARAQRLSDEREQHDEHLRQQNALMVQQRAKADAEQVAQRLTLEHRGEELSQRQSALDQLQAQVADTHREALELRLATEQLWSQMTGQIRPDQLAQSLKHLRAKLAEHFAVAEDSIGRQKVELRELSARLDGQLQRLDDQRQQLRTWAQRRQEEIERQAASLFAREQQLDEQQASHQREGARWQDQRLEYEDEIRRLRALLRMPVAA